MAKSFILLVSLFMQSSFAGDYQTFESGSVTIAYREFGSGEPLVILNGGPGRSSDTFAPLAQTLSDLGLKTFIFDQRGTGKSKVEWNEKNITLDLMLEDLENLRKHLKLETISILGHSFGGMYAMAYASKYPDRVKALILSASAGIDLSWNKYVGANFLSRISAENRQKIQYWEKIEQEQRKKGEDYTQAHLNALRLLAPAYIYNQKNLPGLIKSLANPAVENPPVHHLVWKDADKNYDLKGKLKSFKAPTLILAGRQDILGDEVPLKIHTEIPQSTLHFINECSHYPWLDQPKEYFAAIKTFLKD